MRQLGRKQGPVAFRQGLEVIFSEGAAAQLPGLLAMLDDQACFDFVFQRQAGQFVRGDWVFEVADGLADQQGFLLPVVAQELACREAAQ